MRERIRLLLRSMTALVRAAFVESEQKGRAIVLRRRERLVARHQASRKK